LRLADTLRFRPAAVAPREVAARLRDAVRLLFFLPRGGIFLLRELGSHRREPSKFAAPPSFFRTRRSPRPPPLSRRPQASLYAIAPRGVTKTYQRGQSCRPATRLPHLS